MKLCFNVHTYELGSWLGRPLLDDLLLSGEEEAGAQERAALIADILQVEDESEHQHSLF